MPNGFSLGAARLGSVSKIGVPSASTPTCLRYFPYGRDPAGEQRQDGEEHVIRSPMMTSPGGAAPPAPGPARAPPIPATAAGGVGHQYRTRGSISPLMMSMASDTTITMTAKNVTMPCTAA